jgi:hypothetical protein
VKLKKKKNKKAKDDKHPLHRAKISTERETHFTVQRFPQRERVRERERDTYTGISSPKI